MIFSSFFFLFLVIGTNLVHTLAAHLKHACVLDEVMVTFLLVFCVLLYF